MQKKPSQKPASIYDKNASKNEGTYLNRVKAVFEKPTANIILNGETLKSFPLRSGTDKGVHSHHYSST